ncbi:MAG TPA: hypothetical protein VN894_13275, partial [Polyangiaceae bacterium]|nr:hypothetical protein [Polyangiaceae bacterium]
MGARQRAAQGVIRYQLGDASAARRARAAAAVSALTSLAPLVLAVVLLSKLGWRPTGPVWVVAGALVVLIIVRAVASYGAARQRLWALVVTMGEDAIRVESAREALQIDRARIARVVEVAGPLGGLRVESEPDPISGAVSVLRVPRGGEAFSEVRASLERWRPLERRGRHRPGVRFAVGAVVVAAIFFVPFLLDDFVGRS